MRQARASWQMIGDPTEGAMVVAAAKGGFQRGDMEKVLPRVQETSVRFGKKADDDDPSQRWIAGPRRPPRPSLIRTSSPS